MATKIIHKGNGIRMVRITVHYDTGTDLDFYEVQLGQE